MSIQPLTSAVTSQAIEVLPSRSRGLRRNTSMTSEVRNIFNTTLESNCTAFQGTVDQARSFAPIALNNACDAINTTAKVYADNTCTVIPKNIRDNAINLATAAAHQMAQRPVQEAVDLTVDSIQSCA